MDYLAITADPAGKPVDRQRQQIYTLLDARSIPTTATSYGTAWKGYDLLIVCTMFYENIESSIIVPGSYFDTTTSTHRIEIVDHSGRNYEVYKDGDSAIFVKASTTSSIHGVRIYGLKVY